MAGAAGFEPANAGIKSRCLTAWRRPNMRLQGGGPIAARLPMTIPSVQPHDPMMRIGSKSALDGNELLLHSGRELARPARADREGAVGPRHAADRRNNGGSAAGEGFGQASAFGIGLPLVDGIGFFAHDDAILARKCEQGIARNAGQDCSTKGRRLDRSVTEDEKEVHPAKFFDPAPFGGVEEDHLVKSLRNRLGLRNETRGVVAAAFCRSRASGRCPCVILRNPERNRRGSALEIAADRGC